MNISETFTSIQGEGHLAGKRMYFIRTQGCAIKCPIRNECDEQGALDFKGGETKMPESIALDALAAVGKGGWVCITGGEPTQQLDFPEVVGELRSKGLLVQIQTSGYLRVRAQWDWLTVSPKCPADELGQVYGNELKLIYTGQSMDILRDYFRLKFWNFYLQPLWVYEMDAKKTVAAVHEANKAGMGWELSLQIHKWIGVQ